jgi:hypothetical protein
MSAYIGGIQHFGVVSALELELGMRNRMEIVLVYNV